MSVPKSHAQKCLDKYKSLPLPTEHLEEAFDERLRALLLAVEKDTAEREKWRGPYEAAFAQRLTPEGKEEEVEYGPCYIVECAEEK